MDPKIKNKKVLFVEDDEANQYYLGLILEEMGCSFELASNGQEAVDKVRGTKFNIIFMDLRMPVMDGFKATQIIRQQIDQNIFIVAISANVVPEIVDQCIAAGMNGFIAKGVDVEKFESEMLSWIVKS
ncbi:MAG: response regulator [Candidatus Omnitrophica bacterium]|nr:response regulator [Candidatus Omnitrophota bacterium]